MGGGWPQDAKSRPLSRLLSEIENPDCPPFLLRGRTSAGPCHERKGERPAAAMAVDLQKNAPRKAPHSCRGSVAVPDSTHSLEGLSPLRCAWRQAGKCPPPDCYTSNWLARGSPVRPCKVPFPKRPIRNNLLGLTAEEHIKMSEYRILTIVAAFAFVYSLVASRLENNAHQRRPGLHRVGDAVRAPTMSGLIDLSVTCVKR